MKQKLQNHAAPGRRLKLDGPAIVALLCLGYFLLALSVHYLTS